MSDKTSRHKQEDMDDRRGYARHAAFVAARIIADGQTHDCRILNISESGAKLSTGLHFSQGMTVVLEIEHFGRFGASVVWQNGEELGIKFTNAGAGMSEVILGLAMYG